MDLDAALARLDVIIDAPDGSVEADERTAISDLIAAYEDRHPVLPRGGPLGILRRLMTTHRLSQGDIPEKIRTGINRRISLSFQTIKTPPSPGQSAGGWCLSAAVLARVSLLARALDAWLP